MYRTWKLLKQRSTERKGAYLLGGLLISLVGSVMAEVTFTIKSGNGTERIFALTESPQVEIGYTDTGLIIDFKNLNLDVQCIGGDISTTSGLCLLKVYQGTGTPPGPEAGAPSQPDAPLAQTAGVGAVALSWAAPDDNGATITSYKIQKKREGLSIYSDVGTSSGTGTSYTVTTGLTGGETYRFRIAAVNSEGPSAWSAASDPITVESGTGGGLTLASACLSVPGNVKCDKTFIPENYYQDWGGPNTLPAAKILSWPFILKDSTTGAGSWTLKSFWNAIAGDGYDFKFWISDSPGGERIEGIFCETGSSTTVLGWVQYTTAGSSCELGSVAAIRYMNVKVYKVDANGDPVLNADGEEQMWPYSTGNNAIEVTVTGRFVKD